MQWFSDDNYVKLFARPCGMISSPDESTSGGRDVTGWPPPATIPVAPIHPVSMIQRHATDTGSTDELLIALADTQRRAVVRYFRDSPRDWASVAELADAIRPASNALADDVAIRLHHSTLPHLETVGLLDYDPGNQSITYRGHDDIESLLDAIDEL